MKYKIRQEKKPTLQTFGKYKAVAVHDQTVGSRQIMEEAAERISGYCYADVVAVMTTVAEVVNSHLRRGDKVKLRDWGQLKLEIESEKVDRAEDFNARKHIRGVRLHFIPQSDKGKPELYQKLRYEKATV